MQRTSNKENAFLNIFLEIAYNADSSSIVNYGSNPQFSGSNSQLAGANSQVSGAGSKFGGTNAQFGGTCSVCMYCSFAAIKFVFLH